EMVIPLSGACSLPRFLTTQTAVANRPAIAGRLTRSCVTSSPLGVTLAACADPQLSAIQAARQARPTPRRMTPARQNSTEPAPSAFGSRNNIQAPDLSQQ